MIAAGTQLQESQQATESAAESQTLEKLADLSCSSGSKSAWNSGCSERKEPHTKRISVKRFLHSLTKI